MPLKGYLAQPLLYEHKVNRLKRSRWSEEYTMILIHTACIAVQENMNIES